MRPSASPIAVWIGLVVLYVVWGSTYLGIKVAVETIPPFVMGFLRFVPAGILLAVAVASSTAAPFGGRTAARSSTPPSSARACCSAGWASSRGASRRSPRASPRCWSR